MVLNWWRQQLHPTTHRPAPRRNSLSRSRAKLLVERLEQREVLTAATFNQGFEVAEPLGPTGWNLNAVDDNGPVLNVFKPQNDATRVASGTNGVPSKVGSFHAEAAGRLQLTPPVSGLQDPLPVVAPPIVVDTFGSAFTPYGANRATGYGGVFPASGYTTSVGIYLDVNRPAADNDLRFDWSHAVSNPFVSPIGTHHRDFVFNVGFYDSSQAATTYRPGTGDRFVISGSTNAGRTGAVPGNPDKDPFVLTTTGWYMFEHRLEPAADGFHLKVTLTLRDANGAALHSWVIEPAADTVAEDPAPGVQPPTVGGSRYGWFPSNEFTFLAIDDVHYCINDLIDGDNITYSDNAATLTSGVKPDSGGSLDDQPGAGDGMAQHSMIREITIQLDAAYSDFANPSPGNNTLLFEDLAQTDVVFANTNILNGLFTLQRVQGMGTLAPYPFSLNARYFNDGPLGPRIKLTFLSGSGIIGLSLADGNYNFVIGCTDMQPIFFWRFFGDADGDRDVDAIDKAAFDASNPSSLAMTPAKYVSYFDYFQDFNINVFDLAQFEQRRPKRLETNGKIVNI